MHSFNVTVRFPNIEPDQLDDFKQAAAELIEISKHEPGTLRYDWYMNADDTVCVLHETFANSEACMEHLIGVGSRLGRLMIMGGGMEVECFGNPSAALLKVSEPLAPVIYSLMASK